MRSRPALKSKDYMNFARICSIFAKFTYLVHPLELFHYIILLGSAPLEGEFTLDPSSLGRKDTYIAYVYNI